MKKFTILEKRKIRRVFEDEENTQDPTKQVMDAMPKANLPENIEDHNPESQNTESSESSVSKLFSKLFESREMAHIYHLQVKGDAGSYAAHMALGSYYEGVLDLIDNLVETYQGQYDVVEDYDVIDTKDTKSKDKIEYFKELANFIKNERKSISSDDTHLQNIIDEIVALVYKTLYKLKFNK